MREEQTPGEDNNLNECPEFISLDCCWEACVWGTEGNHLQCPLAFYNIHIAVMQSRTCVCMLLLSPSFLLLPPALLSALTVLCNPNLRKVGSKLGNLF